MIDHISRAFELLIQSGELAPADAKRINVMIPELDSNGRISKDNVIALLLSKSKNPDGAYRNFLSRVQAAVTQAAENAEEESDEKLSAVFRSIKVSKENKTLRAGAAVCFSAEIPKELPQVTARANRDYLPEEYLPGTGCKPEELPRLQQQERYRKTEVAEEKQLCCLLEAGRKELYEDGEYIPAQGELKKVCTASERHLRAADEEQITTCEALADMLDWLEDDKSCLYALLGDYGMGKTFTCRMFAQKLAERCQQDSSLPKPVYFDLRDVPTFVTVNSKTRQSTLEEMLETILRLNSQEEEYTAKELIQATRQGKLLYIFDGLDEKLVYYSNDMRSQFLNELLRVFPQDGKEKVNIIISCRTHHFESITKMDSFLLGLNRSGLRSHDYRSLHLLPFSSEQMLALLTKLLGTQDAAQIFAFIEDEAYLKDLAQRPFLLRQLSRTLPELQELKSKGLPVNASSFYQALMTDSISRDDEKHILKPRHKQLLLMDLAAAFWQESTQVWQIDRLNDWFCAWLDEQPALAAQYREEDWQVLEKDLRNSTLLVRFGEQDFGFSHSSMQEFFLSRWLLRQWQEKDDFLMEQPVSSLSKQFVLDNLALLSGQEQQQLNRGLAATLSHPWSPASDLALTVIREQAKQGRTLPELGTIDLQGAYLSNRRIRGLQGEILLLDRVEANSSQWLDCRFQRIKVGTGNISESLWRDCAWQNFDHTCVGASPCACPNKGDTGRHGGPPLQYRQGITVIACQGPLPPQKTMPFRHPPVARPFTALAEYWQHGHTGPVTSCAFSPDGKFIISATIHDNILKLFDKQGKCINTMMHGHNGYDNNQVTACAFSPNGKLILSAADDNNLKLWDDRGNCIRTMHGHDGKVTSCTFSPNGKYILSTAYDETLRLWDDKGSGIRTMHGHDGGVTDSTFSPDGKFILSVGYDKTLKLWNTQGKCFQTIYGHDKPVTCCAFSPDGKFILSAGYDKTLKLWNAQGKCFQTMSGHDRPVTCCAFSPDGKHILSAADDNNLKLWDKQGNCIKTMHGHNNKVSSCAFSSDGKFIISAAFDNTLKLWDKQGNCIQTMLGNNRWVRSCAFSSDGKLIISVADDNSLKLWDKQGNCIKTMAHGYDRRVSSCAFSPDGKLIISAAFDNTLKLWDIKGNCIKTIYGLDTSCLSCAFSPDGKLIISAFSDATLRLWDIQGYCIKTIHGHNNKVSSCAFSPDGKLILSAADDKTLRLWNAQGDCIKIMCGHDSRVSSCAFSPDGKLILSAADDKTLKLWDAQGNCIRTMHGHDSRINSCAFSPDGKLILSAAFDNTLKLWGIQGNCIKTMPGHDSPILNCVFSPDGKLILSASFDGTLRLWNLDGTVERIFSAGKEQWYTAFFKNNQLEKIIGTEMSWKMANLAKNGKTWHLDELDCFEWVPAQY